MLEAHVLHLLRKYLGEYVEGLSTEALRISVWKGDVVLKDLKLKAEALNSLKLPVTVKAGFVGTITLKVPWKRLGKEPVVVLIDRVFVLAHPAPDGQTLKEEDREKIFDAKLQQIEEAESAALEAASRSSKSETTPDGNSWLGSLIGTIIGNLKVTISNVHIRYEDSVSNPGHPFCSGITLLKLAAVTMDEKGNETFDTSGALDKLRKSLQVQRLAVYHDSDSAPWKLNKKWEDLNPKEWTETFQDGIDEPASYGVVSKCKENHRYLVSPINGVLKYHRLGKNERQDPDIPFEKASLVLSDVSLTMSEAQYYDGIKLIETFSRYKTHVDVSHLRPVISVSQDPHAWWRYAALAGLQQKKLCYWFSWEKIRHLCQLRRRYVQLYAASLQHASSVDLSEIRQIEKILDSKVVILWRLLAHAKVESVKSKEASQRKGNLKRSWWSFGWRTTSEDASAGNSSTDMQLVEEENLTKEEWQAIGKMLSYQADEDAAHLSGKDLQNLIQILVDVSIGQAAARIINIHQTEIVCGRFEQLHVTTKFYNKSIGCDVSLKFYGLSSPKVLLLSEKKINALDASFVHAPVGEDVVWRLSTAIAPCHATERMESYLDEINKDAQVISSQNFRLHRLQQELDRLHSLHATYDADLEKVKTAMRYTQTSHDNMRTVLDRSEQRLKELQAELVSLSGSCIVGDQCVQCLAAMGKGDEERFAVVHVALTSCLDQGPGDLALEAESKRMEAELIANKELIRVLSAKVSGPALQQIHQSVISTIEGLNDGPLFAVVDKVQDSVDAIRDVALQASPLILESKYGEGYIEGFTTAANGRTDAVKVSLDHTHQLRNLLLGQGDLEMKAQVLEYLNGVCDAASAADNVAGPSRTQ